MKSREMREEGSDRKRLQRESGCGGEATAQARFLDLADTDPAMLWVTEPDGSCSFLSRGWYGFTGQTEQEGLGKGGFGWLDAVHPEDREQAVHMFLEANEERKPFSLDYRLRRHDGEYHWAMDAGRPRFGQNREFLGYIGSVLDITDRKRAEQQLRRSEQELADFFENATVGLHCVGPDGMILRANRAELNLLGYATDEYIGHHIAEFHADQGVIGDILRRLTAGEELHDYEARLRCKDGSVRHVLIDSNVLWEDGRFVHTRCFTHDITKRKRAEILLAAEKKVLELIATGAALPEVLDTLMRETEAQSTDGMLCSVLLADEKGQRLLHGAAPSLPPAYNAAVHGMVIGPSAGSCGTAAFERKPVFVTDIAADPRWADFKDVAEAHGLGACHSTPIISSQGRGLGTIAMYYRRPHNPGAHDRQLIERATQLAGIVIERKQAEAALRQSEEQFRVLFDQTTAGIAKMDVTSRFTLVNDRFCDLVGRSREELLTLRMLDIMHPDDVPANLEKFRAVVQGGPSFVVEKRYLRPNGSIVWVYNEVSAVCDSHGQTSHVVAAITDITERKRGEILVNEQQRLLERIAAGNPLDECLHALTDSVLRLQPNARAALLMANADQSAMADCHSTQLPPTFGAGIAGSPINELPIGACGTAIFTGEPVTCADIAGAEDWSQPWRDLCLAHGIRACHSTPVFGSEGKAVASFSLCLSEAREPDSWERRITEFGGYVAGIAIERERAQTALRESEERYRSIFENAVDGIFQTTPGGKYVAVNPALTRIYGYDSPDDMIAAITDIAGQLYVDPKRRDVFLSLMQAHKEVTGFESLVYRKDGSFIWISESARTLRDQAGTVVGYEGTVEDITKRKRTEQRLRATLDQVRTLSGRLAMVQEEERTRIARELHDELGVKLTCLKIDLSRMSSIVGNHVCADLPAKLNDKIGSMIEQVDSTITAVQRLVMELRPALLDNLGLVAAIEWHSQEFQERTGISCTYVTNADNIAMEPMRATAVFRICQEALTNTARHAQATAVMITVTLQSDSLQMMVTDNGVGIPDLKVSDPQSLGLLGMQERAAQCGGTVTIAGDPDKGTTVTLCLPIQPES